MFELSIARVRAGGPADDRAAGGGHVRPMPARGGPGFHGDAMSYVGPLHYWPETSINGKPALWDATLAAEFVRRVGPMMRPTDHVWRVNYYTPRPYVDEYNRGSSTFGFVYTIGRAVCFVEWCRP